MFYNSFIHCFEFYQASCEITKKPLQFLTSKCLQLKGYKLHGYQQTYHFECLLLSHIDSYSKAFQPLETMDNLRESVYFWRNKSLKIILYKSRGLLIKSRVQKQERTVSKIGPRRQIKIRKEDKIKLHITDPFLRNFLPGGRLPQAMTQLDQCMPLPCEQRSANSISYLTAFNWLFSFRDVI